MRGVEIVILVASIGLAGLVAVAVWQGFSGQTLQTTSAATEQVLPAVSKEVKVARGRVAKNWVRHSAATKTNELPGLSLSPDVDSAKKVATAPHGVPDSETLATGTTRSELRVRYGVPTIAVEYVGDGSLVERYYYVKPDRVNMVVVILRDGKVVSAQTASSLATTAVLRGQIGQAGVRDRR